MSINEKSVNQLLHLASVSDDIKTLRELANSEHMNVRRALAKNKNIDKSIGNKLLFDPVLNVSYMASLNPNTTIKREFEERLLTACVKCKIDERKLDCLHCPFKESR
ncbi:hypothetical protein [Halarcobacter anaerophilus]|uniref:Uncharacterized protein n=1 Tax=Halarcobacter anaerophilus TaxID=877500 RepID=A0A4Q0Y653_9BACT|nr:hypothetical protein [Halarcobacter anaerophilus]QDF27524.1 hypothetical protein AANAER_0010 [Halarcobacter anaerophilus]RXJ63881.1 hypothetical protein CRV06_02755 [Halarcobacter anaerophilus]